MQQFHHAIKHHLLKKKHESLPQLRTPNPNEASNTSTSSKHVRRFECTYRHSPNKRAKLQATTKLHQITTTSTKPTLKSVPYIQALTYSPLTKPHPVPKNEQANEEIHTQIQLPSPRHKMQQFRHTIHLHKISLNKNLSPN